MRKYLKPTLLTLSLLLAALTIALWTYAAFYGSRWFTYQGQREYSLALEMYAYRFELLHCDQIELLVRGDIAQYVPNSSFPVPMRGVEHYSTRHRGHAFFFEFPSSLPADNPSRPLPPPVPLPDGLVRETRLAVSGITVGISYWFVTFFALLPTLYLGVRFLIRSLRKPPHPTP